MEYFIAAYNPSNTAVFALRYVETATSIGHWHKDDNGVSEVFDNTDVAHAEGMLTCQDLDRAGISCTYRFVPIHCT